MTGPNTENPTQPPPGGNDATAVLPPSDGVLFRRRKTLVTVNVVVLGFTVLCLAPLLSGILAGPVLIRWMGLRTYALLLFVAWISDFAAMFFNIVACDLAVWVGLTEDRRRTWRLGCLWLVISFAAFLVTMSALLLVCMAAGD